MDSTPSPKDTVWQTELKRKTQKSVVYKRPTLLTETTLTSVEMLEDNLLS
jgi:hypothetical protein